MAGTPTYAIVGANLTGGAAATTLREAGFEGRLVLIGAESHLPYERPPLSKEYLRGETPRQDVYLQPPSWFEEQDVELRLGTRATGLDPHRRLVRLDDGDAVEYDRVLIATGGRNRELTFPGSDLEGIHQLRTIEDADAIREAAQRGGRVAMVGAGFIGLEVTASLWSLGREIEVIEVFGTPLLRVLGPEIGSVFEAIHRDHGITFHLDQKVERFEGTGRVQAVHTDEGTRVECDLVVAGVGIQPNVEIVEGTEIEVDNGILVDECCRTNVPDVFAAGDVANHAHPVFGHRLRVEHYDNALKMGAAAARNMMGADEPFDDPHWFWSDQYDYNLQYVGFAARWDEIVLRGSLEERSFVAFYLKDGVVRGVAGLQRGREVRRSSGLVRAGLPVDPERLRDEDVDLRSLAAR
ncbi:MAG TPA: FAD-dependent oxidoreductase [Actinomycetota bacterium]